MDVRKKVLLDLFASPGTLLPIVGGVSALILSWALDAGAVVNFLGVGGLLAGAGWFVTRLIFGLENMVDDAYTFLHSQESEKQEQALDELDAKLKKDRDPRTQESLRELRRLCGDLVKDVEDGKINRNSYEILRIVQDLFRASVAQLELSYSLWARAKEISGDAKKATLKERDEVLGEVVDTIRHLDKTIRQFRGLSGREKKENLGQLREELDEAIRVAHRTDERLASWDPSAQTNRETE